MYARFTRRVVLTAWIASATCWLAAGEQFDLYNVATSGSIFAVNRIGPPEKTYLPTLAEPNGKAFSLATNTAIQIEWDQPREVREVRLRFAGPRPNPSDVTIRW